MAMTLTRALQLLASVHTLDKAVYFDVLMGPVDSWAAARVPRDQYFEAWAVVREHAGFGAGDASLPGRVIRDVVAQHYGITLNEIMGPSHLRAYARPRHVGMFICVDYARMTLNEAAEIFGNRHHSSVVHALKSVRARRESDPAFRSELATIIRNAQEEHNETSSRVEAARAGPAVGEVAVGAA